jgi:hypothetical protein
MEILFCHFSSTGVALVIENLLEDENAIIILLLFIEVICKLLFEVGIEFQVAWNGRKCTAGIIKSHHPLRELLPDFLVLSERQIAKRPIVSSSGFGDEVLFIETLAIH